MLVLFRFRAGDASDTSLAQLVPVPHHSKTTGHTEEIAKQTPAASTTRSQLFYRALRHYNDDASFVASRHVVRVNNNALNRSRVPDWLG